MKDYKTMSTPMITGSKLSKDDESMEEDQKLYKSMIGRLLYVTISRPNVMQEARVVAGFNLHQRKLMYRQLRDFSGI
jgi:hypothetical protein